MEYSLLNSEQQIEQARLFAVAQKVDIDQVSNALTTLCRAFVYGIGRHVLSVDDLDEIHNQLASGQLAGAYKVLNRRYGDFSAIGLSDAIWCLKAGLSSLSDALGSYWPYMTHESRLNSLAHAWLWHDEAMVAISFESLRV